MEDKLLWLKVGLLDDHFLAADKIFVKLHIKAYDRSLYDQPYKDIEL